MSDPLHDLVEQTRRLSRQREDSETTPSRRRRGERTLETARRSGGLPTPRVVEAEELAEPPESDLFDDFAIFGERISNLMSEANERRSRPQRCSPFTTTRDTQVIVRSRRSRSHKRTANEPIQQAHDPSAGKLAGVGVAVLSILAIAMIALSSPQSQNESRPIARKATPIKTVSPSEVAEIAHPEASPTIIAGSLEEPSSE